MNKSDYKSIYEITNEKTDQFIIGAKGLESVLQNIKTIITTIKGSVFLNRDFGIDLRLLNKPMNEAIVDLITDIYSQVNNYEPRADVLAVNFDNNDVQNGTLSIKVTIGLKEGIIL